MKTKKRTTRTISFWMGLVIFGQIALVSCGGGGGGGGNDAPSEESRWDTMVWDQDDWR